MYDGDVNLKQILSVYAIIFTVVCLLISFIEKDAADLIWISAILTGPLCFLYIKFRRDGFNTIPSISLSMIIVSLLFVVVRYILIHYMYIIQHDPYLTISQMLCFLMIFIPLFHLPYFIEVVED